MKALLNFLILSLTLTSLVNSNVLGIDFGSNFISVGLLSTGRPITIIRNENEKRITPALVSIDGKERFVGTRAVSKVWFLFNFLALHKLLVRLPDVQI